MQIGFGLSNQPFEIEQPWERAERLEVEREAKAEASDHYRDLDRDDKAEQSGD